MSLVRAISRAIQPTKPPLRILVVDDSKSQRHLLMKTLMKAGYPTLDAESGQEALKICERTDVDFVISDWTMPGMTGAEFCREFRKITGSDPAYFILLTAQTDREVLAEGLESGADDFLSKPFQPVELRARIRAGERVLISQKDIVSKNSLMTSALEEIQDLYAAVERDLREARNFQQALVPNRFRSLPGADVSMLYQPSGHVGGDLVGMFRVSETRYGLFSVDVSGHGVASALMTARIAGYFNASSPEQNVALSIDELGLYSMTCPADACRRLNNILMDEIDTDSYLTMVLADVDLISGRVRMCQAGHPSPVIQRANGSVEFVSNFGLPIGLVADSDYGAFEITLNPGDRLFLYSDGITECPLPDESMIDEDGLAEILRSNESARGPKLIEGLVQELNVRSGITEFPDDLSGILLERSAEVT